MADMMISAPSSAGSGAGGYVVTMSEVRPKSNRRAGSSSKRSHSPFNDTNEYLKPCVQNAGKRWKRLHEQAVMERLAEMRQVNKSAHAKSKRDLQKLARKIPIEILAQEWLKDNLATLDIRAYLVDKVFPTLILGVEKLLMEADARGLAEVELMDANFNPLNFLAQYLMRNNPRYSNLSEASPYVRSLREVAVQLRNQLFGIRDNRLARIKAEVKRKREDRERMETILQQEKTRREECLRNQFQDWNVGPTGRVELALLQNALKSFAEMVDKFPEELQEGARFSHPLEPTDEIGTTLNQTEFTEFLSLHVDSLPSVVFDQFMDHLAVCAAAHRRLMEREARRILFTNLFIACDHSGIGILDRHRILNLFEKFYDSQEFDAKDTLRNPRKWPVVEVAEADDTLSDDDEEPEQAVQGEGETQVGDKGEELKKSDDESKKPEEESKKPEEELKKPEEELKKPEEELKKPEEGIKMSDEELKKSDEELKKSEEVLKESGEQEKDESEPMEKTEGETDVVKKVEKDTDKQEGDQTDEASAAKEESGQGVEEKGSSVKWEGGESTQEAADKGGSSSTMKTQEEAGSQEDSSSLLNVTFAEGTAFDREKTNTSLHSRSQSQLSAFDEDSLNVSQFVGLLENFLGGSPDRNLLKQLFNFIKQGYEETEQEKLKRLTKVRDEVLSAKRKVMMDQLFEKWDNDGSGYLDLDEVERSMFKYKDGQEVDAIKQAKKELKKQYQCIEQRLTKREFRTFVLSIVDIIPGADTFDYFMEFLANSLERSHAERIRGEARKKWLQKIVAAAQTSGASMEPVYNEVFQALFKDAESHGGGKKISANIAMLEHNTAHPDRGPLHLRYVAATVEDAQCVLGNILYQDMPGVSFAAVESGKPIHVPRVATHGNIHFWNPDHKTMGSFIVIPLRDRKKRVFGLLGIDTLRDPHHKAIFITHEIQFFQGVAKSFSIAYHHVDLRRKLMKITESAVSWVQKRSPHVLGLTVYMVEPDGRSADYVLRKMMYTDHGNRLVQHADPPRLERIDNLFRDYLFKSVDNSESVTADAYGERHMTFPLRDDEGHAIAVVDISIGTLKKLPPHENKEAQRMMRLLQTALKEITREFAGAETNRILDAEMDDDMRIDIMFDRIMLVELRDNVTKLDNKAYAELSSYNKPPRIVHDILKSTLAVFDLRKAQKHEYDNWSKVKACINFDLAHKIAKFDPTADENLFNPEKVEVYLKDVPHYEVLKHGSLPAQHMFNWVFVTLSLVEHTLKNKGLEGVDLSKSKSQDEESAQGEEGSVGEQKEETEEQESGEQKSTEEIRQEENEEVKEVKEEEQQEVKEEPQ